MSNNYQKRTLLARKHQKEIRQAYLRGVSQGVLGKIFGVSQRYISRVVNGQTAVHE